MSLYGSCLVESGELEHDIWAMTMQRCYYHMHSVFTPAHARRTVMANVFTDYNSCMIYLLPNAQLRMTKYHMLLWPIAGLTV